MITYGSGYQILDFQWKWKNLAENIDLSMLY